MKKILTSLFIISFVIGCNAKSQGNEKQNETQNDNQNGIIQIDSKPDKDETKIQVAILLDTSSSMDGLIDQAKSKLWNIVNTLTTLKYNGKTPGIEISLYEYGNDDLSSKSGYIRQVTALTTDLDLISEKLFSLKTNGGYEYCGEVINEAVKKLTWGDNKSNMKLIYIAGNEGFNQGNLSYKEAISDALKKDIYVNTIYCGDYRSGISELWEDGAKKGQGKYFNIDYNAKVRYISTPYDQRINDCNERLNTTYIMYGSTGRVKKENQIIQDKNAEKISSSNYTERAISKSKAVYKNDSWDLVDKVKDDKEAISKLSKKDLPEELQNKSEKEIKDIVENKNKEREKIQKEISELAKQREEYIQKEMSKPGSENQDDFGNAVNSSIMDFAKVKGYEFKK